MEKKPFYITTTLPYVNAAPHVGFALEIVQADVLARWARACGREVVFNTGTDEHGQKIWQKASDEGKDVQAYVDEYAAKFDRLKEALDLSYTHFIRTTDPHHVAAAQEFWRRCEANGDVYKKAYKVKYCVGCELEKTDSELDDGKCPIHPGTPLQEIDEENWFFRFSKYQKPLLDFYAAHPDFVVPEFRFREIIAFVEAGLQDFSVSRLKEKMPWGVPVPGDGAQVMYVWFDALVNYVSTLGWPENGANFEKLWGTREVPNAVQIAGKDNLRQQTAMWQAMLMSAGLPNTKQVIIHGFITSGGQKMSKSAGNVVDPFDLVARYGTDALRFWLTREMNTFEDGDFTEERFKEAYNAGLANGLGNLASRTLKMAMANGVAVPDAADVPNDPALAEYRAHLAGYDVKRAAEEVWKLVAALDKRIQETEPFKVVKTDPEAGKAIIAELLSRLWTVARAAEPFVPGTAAKILAGLANPSEPFAPLFPRV